MSGFGARELQRGGFASAQRRFYRNRGDGARHRVGAVVLASGRSVVTVRSWAE
jgi:hypothetical protein